MTKLERTYCCIMWEMNGYAYRGDSTQKSLAIELKKYLLAEINSQVKKGKVNDPIFGCANFLFHGKKLAWNRNSWRQSSEVLYKYYKASQLVGLIKKYERIFNEIIVVDFNLLLDSIYSELSSDNGINFSKLLGLNSGFRYVPEEALNDLLNEFKEKYE